MTTKRTHVVDQDTGQFVHVDVEAPEPELTARKNERLVFHAGLVFNQWTSGRTRAHLAVWNPASNRMVFRDLGECLPGVPSALTACNTPEEVAELLQHWCLDTLLS